MRFINAKIVDIGAVLQQQFRDLEVAAGTRQVKRRGILVGKVPACFVLGTGF